MSSPSLSERVRGWRRKTWVRWTMDLVLLVAVASAIFAWQTRNLVGSGELAPEVTFTDLNGQPQSLAALRGKKVVLHFWAPWCGVCAQETGAISRLHRSSGDDSVVLAVAVSYQRLADVRDFIEKHGVDYPVLLGDDRVTAAFRLESFPTTYFLDEEGKVRSTAVGYTTDLGLRWRRWL